MTGAILYVSIIKVIHVTTVILTGALFLLRYFWMLSGTLKQRGSWVQRLPAYNDTLLLISGVSMCIMIRQYPLFNDWLSIKMALILLYILSGIVALRLGRSQRMRILAGVLALLCYMAIVATALQHQAVIGYPPYGTV